MEPNHFDTSWADSSHSSDCVPHNTKQSQTATRTRTKGRNRLRGFAVQAKHATLKDQEDAGLVAFFPVLSTDNNTWDAVTAASRIQPSIRPTSKAKIQEAKVLHRSSPIVQKSNLRMSLERL